MENRDTDSAVDRTEQLTLIYKRCPISRTQRFYLIKIQLQPVLVQLK
jgi:hypothetical protein